MGLLLLRRLLKLHLSKVCLDLEKYARLWMGTNLGKISGPLPAVEMTRRLTEGWALISVFHLIQYTDQKKPEADILRAGLTTDRNQKYQYSRLIKQLLDY